MANLFRYLHMLNMCWQQCKSHFDSQISHKEGSSTNNLTWQKKILPVLKQYGHIYTVFLVLCFFLFGKEEKAFVYLLFLQKQGHLRLNTKVNCSYLPKFRSRKWFWSNERSNILFNVDFGVSLWKLLAFLLLLLY